MNRKYRFRKKIIVNIEVLECEQALLNMVLPFLITCDTLLIVKGGSRELQAEKMRRFFNNFLKVDGDEIQDVLIVVEEDLVLVYRLVREVLVYMKNMMSDE